MNIFNNLIMMTEHNTLRNVIVAGSWGSEDLASLISSKPEHVIIFEPHPEQYKSECLAYLDRPEVKVIQSTLASSTGETKYFLFHPYRFSSIVKPKKLKRIYKKQVSNVVLDVSTIDLPAICKQESIVDRGGNVLLIGINCPASLVLNQEHSPSLQLFDIVVVTFPNSDLYDIDHKTEHFSTTLMNNNFSLAREMQHDSLCTQYVFRRDHQSQKIKTLQGELVQAISQNKTNDTRQRKKDDLIEKLREENKQLSIQSELCESKILELKNSLDVIIQEQCEGKLQLDESQSEVESLSESNNNANLELHLKIEQLNRLEAENKQLKIRSEQLNEQKILIQKQNEKLRSEKEQVDGQNQKLVKDNTLLREKNEKLHNEKAVIVSHNQKLSNETAQVNSRNKELRESAELFVDQMDKIKVERAEEIAENIALEKANSELEFKAKSISLELNNSVLKEKLEVAKIAKLLSENDYLSSKNEELEACIAVLDGEVLKLESQIELVNKVFIQI